MLVLKTNLFCGISDRASWKQWLKGIAPDLHTKLIETQRQTSCRKNTAVMKDIRTELYARQLGNEFETFIKKTFPVLIDTETTNVIAAAPAAPTSTPRTPPPVYATAMNNKHNVFKNYRAGLLTFPHKKILVNPNRQHLEAVVKSFIRDKISVDYIIIEDHAYVEYFNPVYSSEAEKIAKESRDIYQYRLKNGN